MSGSRVARAIRLVDSNDNRCGLFRFGWFRLWQGSRPGEQIRVQSHEGIAHADAFCHVLKVFRRALSTIFLRPDAFQIEGQIGLADSRKGNDHIPREKARGEAVRWLRLIFPATVTGENPDDRRRRPALESSAEGRLESRRAVQSGQELKLSLLRHL